jgi:hypothetical protein
VLKIYHFGPVFQEERTYFPVQTVELNVMETPKNIVEILDENDLYCPDYRQGYVYKKDDKEFKSKQRLIPVLNKIFKQKSTESNITVKKILNFIKPEVKYSVENLEKITKEFNERLKTSRKENVKCLICITHNPYDVAGMSTRQKLDFLYGFR